MDQSTFYVDVENLQEIAKQAIVSAVNNWPDDFPRATALKLYVRADQTELWRFWASDTFPGIEVSVKGVQHYTLAGSKNSADLFLSLDLFADLLKKRTEYVAILSDDSDYASLFAAIKQEFFAERSSGIPFKWFMTSRTNTRSSLLADFFPPQYIYTVSLDSRPRVLSEPPEEKLPERQPERQEEAPPAAEYSEAEKMARSIIQNTPVGSFKSADCKKIIAKNFPNHPFSKLNSSSFGNQFSRVLWPILEKYGVKLGSTNRSPRRYEMTEEAKKSLE